MRGNDRRLGLDDLSSSFAVAMQGYMAGVWTALPGIITAYDPDEMTATVQPAVQLERTLPDGTTRWETITLLIHCPVVFPGGGGFTLTFPLAAGDECLVVFASRCIDSWWKNGEVQNQAEFRLHDLGDGFVLPGVRSVPRVLNTVSTTEVQLRSDDGLSRFSIDADGNAAIVSAGSATVEAGGNVAVTAASGGGQITLRGNVTIQGSLTQTGGNATMSGNLVVTGEVTGAGITLSKHQHRGVSNGNSATAGPNNYP